MIWLASIQQTAGGMPVLILKEGTKENKGREAQKNNFNAAKLVAEIIRSSLGPRGMDKMLVDSLGDVTITNDGATILKEIVNTKGNNLNNVGTANSVSSIISCTGWINILLSIKNPEPKPMKISLVIYPKYIENKANITKGKLINISLSWAFL